MKRSLFFAILLVLGLTLPSFAQEEWGEIRYAVRPLNVRADRDAGARRITTLKQGERVKVDYLKDDWYAVFRVGETVRSEKNALGYSFGKYLKPVANARWGRIMQPDRNLNVRTGRGPGYRHVVTLMKGDKIKVDFLKDGWYAVFKVDEKRRDPDRAIGYSIAKYLVPAKADTHSADSWGEHRHADRMLTVRKEPNPRSPHVRTLQKGEHVKVGKMIKGWYAVYEPGETDSSRIVGYSNGKYLLPAKSGYTPPTRKRSRAKPEASSAAKKSQPKQSADTQTVKKSTPEPEKSATDSTAASGVWGDIVSTPRKIILREKPNESAEESIILQRGELVKIDFEKNGWVGVFPINESKRQESRVLGWAPRNLLVQKSGTSDSLEAFNAKPTVKHVPQKTDSGQQQAVSGKPKTTRPAAKPAPRPTPEVELKKETAQKTATESEKTPAEKDRASSASSATQARSTVTPKPVEMSKMAPARTRSSSTSSSVQITPSQKSSGVSMSGERKKSRLKPEDIRRDTRNPGTDEVRHGFRFKVLDKKEIRTRIERFYGIVVFVDLDTLPDSEALQDLAATIWKENRRNGILNQVNLYLPGVDRSGPAYAVARFDENGNVEYWERKSVLFGTRFY